jgi:thioredoxin 1
MAISTVIHTNGQSVDRVLATGLPILLAFWRRTSPIPTGSETQLDQLAARYAGKAIIAKVDADSERTLIDRFKVGATPAYLVLRGQRPVAELAGATLNDAGAWLAHLVDGAAQPAPRPASSSNMPITVTDADFQSVIAGPGPILVDFWAPWCGPCRMVAPHVEQLAKDFAGRAVIAKMNVDENPQTSQRYQIMSIPALFIFKDGAVVDRIVGAQPLQILQQHLTRYVRSA